MSDGMSDAREDEKAAHAVDTAAFALDRLFKTSAVHKVWGLRPGVLKALNEVLEKHDYRIIATSDSDVRYQDEEKARTRKLIHDLAGAFARLTGAVEVYGPGGSCEDKDKLREERVAANKKFNETMDKY